MTAGPVRSSVGVARSQRRLRGGACTLDRSMRVLITDGDERAALAAARSLRSAGAEVHVTARSRVSLAGVAAGVRGWAVPADPRAAPGEYAAAVARLSGALDVRLLLPITDASVEAVLAHRDVLPPGVVVPFPPLASFRAASDKLRVLTLARAAGFAAPETRVLAAPAEAATADLESVLPGVVKPHRSLVTADGVHRKVGVAFVGDPAACRRAVAALPPAAFPVLVQRGGRGRGCSCCGGTGSSWRCSRTGGCARSRRRAA